MWELFAKGEWAASTHNYTPSNLYTKVLFSYKKELLFSMECLFVQSKVTDPHFSWIYYDDSTQEAIYMSK